MRWLDPDELRAWSITVSKEMHYTHEQTERIQDATRRLIRRGVLQERAIPGDFFKRTTITVTPLGEMIHRALNTNGASLVGHGGGQDAR